MTIMMTENKSRLCNSVRGISVAISKACTELEAIVSNLGSRHIMKSSNPPKQQ